MKKAKKYKAFCVYCFGGGKDITSPTNKKYAEACATGHTSAFGWNHIVRILEVK